MSYTEYIIKKAVSADLETVKKIYDDARLFMRANGNPTQWSGGYPSEELLLDDIKKEQLYICIDPESQETVGVFCFFIGSDPTYVEIYEGKWIRAGRSGVIHRIATTSHSKGVAKACFDYGYSIAKDIKIDTHRDNIPMQKCLLKNGFKYCGIIYLPNGDERLAYQKCEAVPSDELEKIIRKKGEIILTADTDHKKHITEKSGDSNFVTEYDLSVQCFLKEKLSELCPSASFFAEEDGEAEKELGNEYTFIIDPIDGTTNFMCGYNHSSISVALTKNAELLFGAVYDPYANDYFHAVKGEGAYLGSKRISVSDRDSQKAIILVGSAPYYKEEFSRKVATFVYDLLQNFADFRRTASAALDTCYVASGRADGFCEPILSPWDYAAGILITEEAGGIATDYEGNNISLTKPSSVLIASPKQYEKLFEICKIN